MAGTERKPIFAIVGPTASGKTSLGVELARHLGNGEVINCDSVQIYRDIKIATAKPEQNEMKGVPHHLISYVDPRQNYTAAGWAVDAGRTIAEIEARGSVAILVGGTGFYLRTLREPLFDSPKTDKALRRKLTGIRHKKGAEHLHDLLNRIDPRSAAKLYPRDYPRVQRAIEVFFQTGNRISDLQPRRAVAPEFANRITVYALRPPRDKLYDIINARSLAHFENGLVEEVQNLLENGVPDTSNALGSHGYRRVCEYLRGERSLESALEKTQQDVRNYAKRQLSWFRRESGTRWLTGFGTEKDVRERLFDDIG